MYRPTYEQHRAEWTGKPPAKPRKTLREEARLTPVPYAGPFTAWEGLALAIAATAMLIVGFVAASFFVGLA